MCRSTAPVRSASCCQGTRFEWCSIVVSRISSPACTLASPQLRATVLMLAVVPGVKMISCDVLRADERPHFFAGLFVLLGAALAERVDAAVDVGVVVLVDAPQHVDHLPRPLRAGGVVEKHQRLVAVHHLLRESENRRAALPAAASSGRRQDWFFHVSTWFIRLASVRRSTGEWTADCSTFQESRQHFWRFGVSRGP